MAFPVIHHSGGGKPWTPKNVSGLKLWLRADDIIGADTDPVTTWSDSSGNAHHATEATAPPTLKTNIVNGRSVVRFDGSNDYLTIAHHADLNLTAPFHIFTVLTVDAVSGTYMWWASKASAWQLIRYADKLEFATTGKTEFRTTLGWHEVGVAKINEYIFDASYDTTFGINGWSKEKITDSADPSTNTNVVLIGRSGTTYLDGDIAEILIYSGSLSAVDRNKINQYLATRYGLYISAADVDLATASRAAAPLTTTTSQGSSEAAQPDVVYVDAGWNSYKYWMALTPYVTTDRKETVDVLASADGNTWEVPTGGSNPLRAEVVGTDYADPCLFFSPDGLTLNCVYYRTKTGEQDSLILKTTTDGIAWSAEQTIFTATGGEILRSPSILWDGSQYVLWTCETTAGKFKRRTCATLTGTWSDAIDCVFKQSYTNLPAGFPYHGHVKLSSGIYYGLYSNASNYYLVSSGDGITWQVPRGNTLAQGSGTWDSYMYSGTILKIVSGGFDCFDCFYSARTGDATPVYRIGRTTITGISGNTPGAAGYAMGALGLTYSG